MIEQEKKRQSTKKKLFHWTIMKWTWRNFFSSQKSNNIKQRSKEFISRKIGEFFIFLYQIRRHQNMRYLHNGNNNKKNEKKKDCHSVGEIQKNTILFWRIVVEILTFVFFLFCWFDLISFHPFIEFFIQNIEYFSFYFVQYSV